MKRKKRIKCFIMAGGVVLFLLFLFFVAEKISSIEGFGGKKQTRRVYTSEEMAELLEKWKPEIDVQLLTPNAYSRPQHEISDIKGIVIHYTANPQSTALQNRNYFEGLKESKATMASSHFIVGIEGEIVQCIPTWEMSYASNQRNSDTIAIEVCHLDESGKFTKETYEALVDLTSWLCVKFNISEEDVIRHYDVNGKACPKYFVENEEEWDKLKQSVGSKIDEIYSE